MLNQTSKSDLEVQRSYIAGLATVPLLKKELLKCGWLGLSEKTR